MRAAKMLLLAFFAALAIPLAACAQESDDAPPPTPVAEGELAEATFAGGCFWCVEQAFDEVEGVVATISGYTGGDVPSPTYEQVSAGGTGHAEAVRVRYDPDEVSYAELLYEFWRNIDPFAKNRQFCDVGSSYRSAVFYHTERQRRLAVASKGRLAESFTQPIQTEIAEAQEFWPAEEYHQNYYQKNPIRYKYYKWSCGRVDRLEEIWGEQAGGQA